MKKPELEKLLKERDTVRDTLCKLEALKEERTFLAINKEYSASIGHYLVHTFNDSEIEVITDNLKGKLGLLESKLFNMCQG